MYSYESNNLTHYQLIALSFFINYQFQLNFKKLTQR